MINNSVAARVEELNRSQDLITDIISHDYSISDPDGLMIDVIRTHALQNKERIKLLENSQLTASEQHRIVELIEQSIEEITKALKPDMHARLHEMLLESRSLSADEEQLDRDLRFYHSRGDGVAGISHFLANVDYLMKYVPILNTIEFTEILKVSNDTVELLLPPDSDLLNDNEKLESVVSMVRTMLALEKSKLAGDKVSRLPGEALQISEDKIHNAIIQALPGHIHTDRIQSLNWFFECLFSKTSHSVFRTVQELPNLNLNERVMALIGALKAAEVSGIIKRPVNVPATFLKSQAVSLKAHPGHASMVLENIRVAGYESALYEAYNYKLPQEPARSIAAIKRNETLHMRLENIRRRIDEKESLLNSYYGLDKTREPLVSLNTYAAREFAIIENLTEPKVVEKSLQLLELVDQALEPVLKGYYEPYYQLDKAVVKDTLIDATALLSNAETNIHRMLMAHREFGLEQVPYKRIIVNNAMNSTPVGAGKLLMTVCSITNPFSVPVNFLTASTDLNSSVHGRVASAIDGAWERFSSAAASIFPYNKLTQSKLTLGLDIKLIVQASGTSKAQPFHESVLAVCGNDAEYALLTYCGLAKSAANVGLIEGADTNKISKVLTRAYSSGETTQQMALSALSDIDETSDVGEKIKNVAAKLIEFERTEESIIERGDERHSQIAGFVTQYGKR